MKEGFKFQDKIDINLKRRRNMETKLVLKGEAIIERREKFTGKVLEREKVHNLIVNTGKERVAKLIGNTESSLSAFGYIAIGTGSTAPNASDTSLETEVTRASGSPSYEASYKCIFEKTFEFGSGESYSITEAGVSDGASETGSTLLDRFTFSAKAVDADTDLYVKITITVS